MVLSKIIRLFIPPVYYKIKKNIYDKRYVPTPSPLPQIKHGSEKLVIIGNGPSLIESVEKFKCEIVANDRICVNFFASSDLYEVLKPNIYVFADPAFFWVPENQENSMRTLFDNMVNKTTWDLRVVIPYGAKDAPMLNQLRSNKNITIDFYNSSDQDVGKMTKYEAWDKNLVCPPSQNVLNVCIYLALFWEYPEIYLIGADSSFLEDIRVDQDTNELFSVDRHFYQQDKVYSDKKLFETRGRVRSDWKLHELIQAYGRMFEYYYELREYADYKGLKVYNASEYSWINCFERKKLSDL